MTLTFNGTLQDLEDKLIYLDLEGEWQEHANGVWKLRCRDRAGLLRSTTKGTVWFEGPKGPKETLAKRVQSVLGIRPDEKPHGVSKKSAKAGLGFR